MGASFGDGLASGTDAQQPLPDVIEAPVLPLRDMIVYPRAVTPLTVMRERSLRALDMARTTGLAIGLAQKNADVEDPRPSDMFEIGTLMNIGRVLNMPDGSASLIVQGRTRVRVLEWKQATPYLLARVEVLHEPIAKGQAPKR